MTWAIIIILIAIWVIYSIIVSPKEKAIRYKELELLATQYGLSDNFVKIIKTNYIDKHKFVLFNKIKSELNSIEEYYKTYGAETNLSLNEFQKECIHHICGGSYNGNNTLALFVKNKLMKRLQNRPLPNTQSSKFNVPTIETIEDHDLSYDINKIKLNTLAQISYIDAHGQKSDRRITMKSLQQGIDNDYLIQSYCHEKKSERTFKLSRISSLIDMETGEVFADPRKYFLDRIQDSPIGKITKCFQDFETEILILTFVARADGFLRKKEREIIMNFVNQKSSFPLDVKLMDDEIRRIYCDSSDFRTALKTLNKKTNAEKEIVLQLATEIVQTDKTPDPMELGTLDLIKRELKIDRANA